MAIVGDRPPQDPGALTFSEFDRREEALRQTLRSSADGEEIVALLSAGQFGGEGQIVLRFNGDHGRLSFWPDDVRTFERDLSSAEINNFRAFLARKKAYALAALGSRVYDGRQFELVRLTKEGGRRLYMNNPALAGDRVYQGICEAFRTMLRRPGLALHYVAEEKNPALKVLISDPRWSVVGVRMDGRRLIVELVGRRRPQTDDVTFPELYRIKAEVPARAEKEPTWVAWPSAEPISGERLTALSIARLDPPTGLRTMEWLNQRGWAIQRDGVGYLVGELGRSEGLWRVSAGRPPELIVEGKMSSPVLEPDGRSIVLVRTDGRSWGPGQYFARIDIRTKQVHRLDIETADDMDPIIATPYGVLVGRARANAAALAPGTILSGPMKPEHFLVTAGAGGVRKVEGDFDPIPRGLRDPFQAAGPDLIWAMKTDWRMRSSVLGRYDLKRFVFTRVKEVAGVAVGTNDIWVDEQSARLYALHDGDLLSLPLNSLR